jgi:pSer/pThr/pTyr-binding forkhead associated (FHA) protein
MDDKLEILERIMPIAVLRALTPAAALAIPQLIVADGLIAVYRFPYRVGRESRLKIMDGRVERIERVRLQDLEPNNDLYLVDDGHLLNISREHFQIEQDGDKYYVYDRGSACGTRVGDVALGSGKEDCSVELKDGDIITVGTQNSPYRYEFILLD